MPKPQFVVDGLTQAEIWRTIPLSAFTEIPNCRHQVYKRLEKIVEQVKFAVPDAGEEFDLLASGDMRPFLQALSQVAAGSGALQLPRIDLRMSMVLWAWLRSQQNWSYGHPAGNVAAPILMAAGLAQFAQALPPPNKETLETPRHRRTPAQRDEVVRWQKRRRGAERMALEWLRATVNDEWLGRLDYALNAHPTKASSNPAPAPEHKEEPEIKGPSRVVMAKPLDAAAANSREKKEEAKYWNHLSRPMPLVAAPDPDQFAAALLAEFPWMRVVVDRITAELRLRQHGADADWFRLRPLLLAGPPAAGKSRFARRLGELAGLTTRIMSVAGSSDSRELLGTSKGWGNALPSGPVRLLREAGQANPLMILDEIDKVGETTQNGRITDALLAMLEPETARQWYDEGLGRPVDLTSLNWIFLANSLTPIPAALKSRLAIIQVARPKSEHFPIIMQGLLNDIAQELGLTAEQLPGLHPEAAEYLRKQFGRGASMRQVRSAICRALAVLPQKIVAN